MKAAYYYEPKVLKIEDVDIPVIGDSEMLIKVRASSVCGTDLRIFNYGHFKIQPGERRVLGHEIAGDIVALGKDVKGYRTGMRVALPPNIGCGICPMCINGYNQLCPDYEAFGISLDGGFQEYLRIPASAIVRGNVIEIPDEMSYVEAALIEPFSCTYNAFKALDTRPGDTVLIIGAGPIGACHVIINKLAGAAKVIVADISPERLVEIQKFGADVTINSAQEDIAARVSKATRGLGPDVVITACSIPSIQGLALDLAGRRGRVCFFGGMPKGKELVTLNTNNIHYKELKVVATTGSSITDYYKCMQIVASGKTNLAEIGTARFSISQTLDAFEYAASGKGMKALIVND